MTQAKAEKEFQGEPEQPIDAEEAERASKEADSRSVYVGNVDYDCTPEELQRHFQVERHSISQGNRGLASAFVSSSMYSLSKHTSRCCRNVG